MHPRRGDRRDQVMAWVEMGLGNSLTRSPGSVSGVVTGLE